MQHEVRRPVFDGSRMVRGLWFDGALHGEAEVRRRVLAAWEPGARAYRVHDGYVLEWKRARRMICAHAPGLPLCEQDGLLASAPLSPQERAPLQPGSAVLVFGATVHAHVLTPALRVDPALWLDLSSLPLLVPLRMPSEAVAGFVPAGPAPAPDVRSILGDAVPPPSPQRAEFFRQTSRARDASPGGAGAANRALGALGLAAAAALALSGAMSALFIAPFRLSRNGGGTAAPARAAPGTPTGEPLACQAGNADAAVVPARVAASELPAPDAQPVRPG